MDQNPQIMAKHWFFACFLVLVVASCSPSLNPNGEVCSSIRSDRKEPLAFPFDVYLTCDGNTFHYDSTTIRQLYSLSRECLAYHGMMGDTTANEIIAWLVKNRGDGGQLYRGLVRSTPYFRGPEVFEALLSRLGDHRLLDKNPVIHEGQIQVGLGYTSSRTIADFMWTMMKDVDGLALPDYIFREEGIVDEGEIVDIGYGHNNRYSILLEKHLKDAWQKGLIKLKPYGED